jgi:hypothetical protein
MQGIYTYIPETNNVPMEYNVAAILSLLCMVPISLVRVLTLQCTFTLALSVAPIITGITLVFDRLCGLVVRVPGYRYRGPGFDSRGYQIF